MTNSHLYFKGRMYIPPHEQQAITHFIYDSPTTGHAGCFRTKALLKRDFWWLGLSPHLSTLSFLDSLVCQQNKINHHHPTCPPLAPIPSSSFLPFKQLAVDLVTDLPPSNGHDSLMVMINQSLTKGVILIPCSKTINVAEVAKLFLHHVFKQFGLMIPRYLTNAHSSHPLSLENWPNSSTTMSSSPPHITLKLMDKLSRSDYQEI